MEKTNNDGDRYATLKETGRLPKFLDNALGKYSSAIVRLYPGRESVHKSNVIDQASTSLIKFTKAFPNAQREDALWRLMYDLLPAKNILDDEGELEKKITNDTESSLNNELAETLQGLPALMVGAPIFDASSGIQRSSANDESVNEDLLLEVVKKDVGAKYKNDEYYIPRNKLARLSLVFLSSTLFFLFNQVRSDDDFNLFIERVRSGDIPACLISRNEIIRTIDFHEFIKNSKDKKTNDSPPTLPAFARVVGRYKTGENLDDILDTFAKEEPYSKDWTHTSKRDFYTMVPLTDHDDSPDSIK